RSDSGSGETGVDAGAAGGRVVGPLEDEHTSALTKDETIAGLVPRPRGPLRLVVAGGHGAHRGEAGDRQRVDDRLGAAGHHDVGPAGPDDVHALGDRLGAGRAGTGYTVDTGPGSQLESDVGSG